MQSRCSRVLVFCCSSRRRHTRCALVTGVQTCALPILRTADSVSPLDAPAVAASLLAFVIVYFAVFGAGTWYILRLMAKPPEPHESATLAGPVRTAGITPASQIGGTH